MGMKDQFQDKSRQAKEKMDQARGKAGQRGQQGRPGQPQRERGGRNPGDIEDTERHVRDRSGQYEG